MRPGYRLIASVPRLADSSQHAPAASVRYQTETEVSASARTDSGMPGTRPRSTEVGGSAPAGSEPISFQGMDSPARPVIEIVSPLHPGAGEIWCTSSAELNVVAMTEVQSWFGATPPSSSSTRRPRSSVRLGARISASSACAVAAGSARCWSGAKRSSSTTSFPE
jgi:hypothetical protein